MAQRSFAFVTGQRDCLSTVTLVHLAERPLPVAPEMAPAPSDTTAGTKPTRRSRIARQRPLAHAIPNGKLGLMSMVGAPQLPGTSSRRPCVLAGERSRRQRRRPPKTRARSRRPSAADATALAAAARNALVAAGSLATDAPAS